jgi:tetratricopeptide (TPR) repeat protein
MIRRCLSLLAIAAFCITPSLAQRSSNGPANSVEVVINVAFDDNNEIPKMCRVQLLTSARMPVAEVFLNDRGQANFRVSSGSYMVQTNAQDAESGEATFVVNPRETMHNEWVRIKRKPINGVAVTSTEGSISTAALNIPDKAKKEFEKGVSASGKQDLRAATEHFTKAAELYPQFGMAFVNLGAIAMQEGNSAEGQRYFEAAIKADPQLPNGYVSLARVRVLQQSYDEADTLLVKALSVRPLDPEPLTILATSQLRSGKLDQAIASAKKVHSLPHERFAVVHLLAADALVKQHRLEAAEDEYRVYLKEQPMSPHAESVRAQLQSLERQTKGAPPPDHYRQ